MSNLNRAYSVLTITKASGDDDDERVIEGVATTIEADRVGDIVEPQGAVFKLPIPLLWMHDSTKPIGHVTSAKVTKNGIEIVAKLVKLEGDSNLKKFLDDCWLAIKSTLVRGLSIGFNSIEYTRINDTWSYRYTAWEWLELSACVIPMNVEANITSVKSTDRAARAALGLERPVVSFKDYLPKGRKSSPGASGSVKFITHQPRKD